MPPALSLDAVTKRFGQTVAVADVSLDLHEGEFVALLGASGCGKSTTLRLFAGLEAPSAGRVMRNGEDVTAASAAARNIALMFQSYALYPHLSVYHNIAMPLRLRRLSAVGRLPGARLFSPHLRRISKEIDQAVQDVAQMLRLDGLLARKPGQLSGGQQQRVALARALVRQPSAFLLDEPLSNLDTQLRAETREEICNLHRRSGYPFLLVTHDQSDALSMADRVAIMIEGKIAQIGTPSEVFHRPATRDVAQFIGHHRINMLRSGAAAALHPAGQNLDIGVRPEDLILTPSGPLQATVEHLDFHGEETILRLRGPDEQVLRAVLRGQADLPSPGQTVQLGAKAEALHSFDAGGARQEITA